MNPTLTSSPGRAIAEAAARAMAQRRWDALIHRDALFALYSDLIRCTSVDP